MTSFTINGVEREIPVPTEHSVQDLIRYLERNVMTDSVQIASIKVNGQDMALRDAENGEGIAASPVEAVGSLEVVTAHPREIAEETLQNLLDFTGPLESMCVASADLFEAAPKDPLTAQEFVKLIDFLATFVEGVQGVRRLMRVSNLNAADVLEADLHSLLRDLHDFYRAGDLAYVVELLRAHLPANIEQWRAEGLPALVRSRDS